jgi:hypothetical protein
MNQSNPSSAAWNKGGTSQLVLSRCDGIGPLPIPDPRVRGLRASAGGRPRFPRTCCKSQNTRQQRWEHVRLFSPAARASSVRFANQTPSRAAMRGPSQEAQRDTRHLSALILHRGRSPPIASGLLIRTLFGARRQERDGGLLPVLI